MAVQRIGDLEIQQDLDFSRRQLRVQKIGWAVMALIIAVALGGAFGDGPLADAHAGAAGGAVRVNYHRIDRKHRPTVLAIDLGPEATTGDEVNLFVSDGLFAGTDLDDVVPEPTEMRAVAGGTVFVIGIERPGEPVTVRMAYQYNRPGRYHARIGIADGPLLKLSVTVLP